MTPTGTPPAPALAARAHREGLVDVATVMHPTRSATCCWPPAPTPEANRRCPPRTPTRCSDALAARVSARILRAPHPALDP